MRYYVAFDGGNAVTTLPELGVKVFDDYDQLCDWVKASNRKLDEAQVPANAHRFVGVGSMKALRECLGRDPYEWRAVECLRRLGEFVLGQ